MKPVIENWDSIVSKGYSLFSDRIIGTLMKQEMVLAMQSFLYAAMNNCGQNPKIISFPLVVSHLFANSNESLFQLECKVYSGLRIFCSLLLKKIFWFTNFYSN